MTMRHIFVSFAIASGFLTGAAQATSDVELRVEQTEWVLRLPGGEHLRSPQLVGATLQVVGGVLLRIDSAELQRVSGHQWWAHGLSVHVPERGWQPLCSKHTDGTQYAIVLPGREMADGSLVDDPDAFAVSCTSGALAKCLRLGYEPWRANGGGASLRPAFNACVRMIRADYGGQGVPYTAEGRRIDVYDKHGIQRPEIAPDQAFEAGWDEHGAVCVHHARVAEKVALRGLENSIPRLRGNVGSICTEAYARALGAIVFNRSQVPVSDPDGAFRD
jgi:hypothetical protein